LHRNFVKSGKILAYNHCIILQNGENTMLQANDFNINFKTKTSHFSLTEFVIKLRVL
jgi:hypothetical protein